MSEHFDSYADSYGDLVAKSIAFSGGSLVQYTARKAALLVDLARRHLGDPGTLRVVDVGCGVGLTDGFLAPCLGELHGIDTAPKAIEQAKAANETVEYHAYPGGRLPFADEEFDLSFAICVLHHVARARHAEFAAELARVVRPGGLVAVFEHNPLNPLTRVAVHRCEFDRDAVLLGRRRAANTLAAAGLEVVERRHILFLPFAKSWTKPVERGLAWLPLGAQYYVVGRKP